MTEQLEELTRPDAKPIAAILSDGNLTPEMESVVQQMIEKVMGQKIAEQQVHQASQPTEFVRGNRVAPQKYRKHYRNDVQPNVTISMRHVNEDGTLGEEIRGGRIQFRRGHFFSTTEEQDTFLEWKMANPATDPTDDTQIIGGNPHIYIDDGMQLVSCPYCAERFVAGSNALKAHKFATHGVRE